MSQEAKNGLSTGRDITIRINMGGQLIDYPINSLESFEATPLAPIKNFIPINGLLIPELFHEGWEIKMSFGRFDDTLDKWWSLAEAAYYAKVPQPYGVLTETIVEPDSSISQYQYTGLVLKLENSGMWKGTEFVIQTLSGYASRKQQLV